ncbi:hypothetical protein LMH87_007471 [Akanthomyces muscarius]|uniref:Uncharacterized protein n=1 Tax=Akanthomyces muscarius TaxID=2231603 RepID=A0A9W8QSC2_AKAMU|nr:hypothetical protein LMH87_007471 [Akanthomyces muscarius]KAJ4165861.1 hypothetical protein LMH87_007471 [Akanthomyces muscarius]
MAPVQTFSSSPITAAKAPTATAMAQSPTANKTAPATTTAAASASAHYGPASAQPGSRPFVPAATASAYSAPGYYAQPTPTQPLADNNNNNSPPAPQPGAVPTAPGAAATAASSLPPPPKNGETMGPEHTGSVPPMPAQMSYPAPQASHAIRGTSTADAAAYPSPYEAGPVPLPVGTALGGGINRATDMSHPPGYQQDTQAAEFSSGQRVAHDFSSSIGGGYEEDGSASIWNTAKKWASAAGDTLAAAEGEVWKAVNKDQK